MVAPLLLLLLLAPATHELYAAALPLPRHTVSRDAMPNESWAGACCDGRHALANQRECGSPRCDGGGAAVAFTLRKAFSRLWRRLASIITSCALGATVRLLSFSVR